MIKFIVVYKNDRDIIYTRPFPGASGWKDICDSISAKKDLDTCPAKFYLHETQHDAEVWITEVGLYNVVIEPFEVQE